MCGCILLIKYVVEKSWSEEHPIETITTPQQLDSPADTQLTPEIENSNNFLLLLNLIPGTLYECYYYLSMNSIFMCILFMHKF